MDKVIHHLDMLYYEIPLDESLSLVHGLIREGNEWHSHAISPGCRFNPYYDLYAVMIEDNTNNKIYIATSKTFPDVDKELVKMLHGDDILSDEGAADYEAVARSSELLSKVIQLNSQGVQWHHHMNFPKCLMTPHTNKWMITVEAGTESFSEEYNEEPGKILNCLEVLYFNSIEAG